MSRDAVTAAIVFGSVFFAAALATFGFFVKQWINGLSDDMRQLGGVMNDAADRMGGFDRRLTRVESALDMHLFGHPDIKTGGRRSYDLPDSGNDHA